MKQSSLLHLYITGNITNCPYKEVSGRVFHRVLRAHSPLDLTASNCMRIHYNLT